MYKYKRCTRTCTRKNHIQCRGVQALFLCTGCSYSMNTDEPLILQNINLSQTDLLVFVFVLILMYLNEFELFMGNFVVALKSILEFHSPINTATTTIILYSNACIILITLILILMITQKKEKNDRELIVVFFVFLKKKKLNSTHFVYNLTSP